MKTCPCCGQSLPPKIVVLVLIIVFALLQLIPEVGGIHLRGFG